MGERKERSVAGTPALVGVGLRAPHLLDVQSAGPAVGFLEVHAENYMGGGPALSALQSLRCDYPISLHGVGVSLGSAAGIDRGHLERFRALIERTSPFLVSEHLAWSVTDGVYLNDLLPLPYTEESLEIVARNILFAQEILKGRILVENPSRYLEFSYSPIPEPDFLAELHKRTGCAILCDVNNIFVTCSNLDLDCDLYIEALPVSAVREIHLAGHSRVTRGGLSILIDDHASIVSPRVWRLYEHALARFGAVPSLVEWDKNLPPFETLVDEARKAESIAQTMADADARAA
jgi:uncharacterized protein